MAMLAKFLPKQNNFFVLFRQTAEKLVLAATEFRALVNDLNQVKAHAQAIAVYEHEGDEVTLSTFQQLHKTFITPFDRHDIHALTMHLDDILDSIHRLAQRFLVYHFAQLPAEMLQLVDLVPQIMKKLQEVVAQLESLKNVNTITYLCQQIDELENDADAVLLRGIDRLFAEENDFKQLLKLKEVYEKIKLIIDACQDVANFMKSIILEYA